MSLPPAWYTPEATTPARRDRLSPWVIALLVLFLGRQLYDVGLAPLFSRAVLHKPVTAATQTQGNGLDDDAMQDLIQVDLQTKAAYLSSLARPEGPSHLDPQALRSALKSAEQLQRESGNSPSAARRLLLLRSLLPPGRGAVPPLAVGKGGLDPLAAFGSSLPPDIPPQEKARYAAEGQLWRTVFQGGRLSPGQRADAEARIRRLPNIRWWAYPALQALATGQGDDAGARRYATQARDKALPSVALFGVIGLVRFGFILLGALMLLYLFIRWLAGRGDPHGKPLPDLWPTLPPAIPDAQRRLGAGDLMGVFVLYLLTREVISIALGGLDVPRWFHVPHAHLPGLLDPFRPRLAQMPAAQRTTVGIVLETVVYLLSALPPILVLCAMARRRGASLADEIGWTRRRLGVNLLYGAGGFAVASFLMIVVAFPARWIFRHAPDPSNPVIPQLIGTTGFWAPFLLVLLASVGAPLVEEFLFRGVLYQAARLRLGVWPAIIVSGLIFGFVHPVGIASMLAIATLGGVFAWMAETRKSLAPSMLAHFLQNFTTTILLLSVLGSS